MYLLSLAAAGLLVWGFWKRLPHWRQRKSLNRFDRYEERDRQLVSAVFGQERIARIKDLDEIVAARTTA